MLYCNNSVTITLFMKGQGSIVGSYNSNLGRTFKTGNAVVAQLPLGSALEVVGAGQLQVTDIPVQDFQPGDRIYTKHGFATVVRMTSRLDNPVESGQVLYIADGTVVVRIADLENVNAA